MKALLVAALLFGSASAFAQVTYVDIPADEAAMAHAPADALKKMDEAPPIRTYSKLTNKCSKFVEQAADIARPAELSSFGDYAKVVVNGILGQPLRDAYNIIRLKGEFIRTGCGDGNRFNALAESRTRTAKMPTIPHLEASASVHSRHSSAATQAIRPHSSNEAATKPQSRVSGASK